MSEGRGGKFNGVTIKRILKSENVLQDLKTILHGAVGEAAYQFLKVTYELYLLCTKPEVDSDYNKIIQQYKQKFLVLRCLLQFKWTLKQHVCIGEYTIFN